MERPATKQLWCGNGSCHADEGHGGADRDGGGDHTGDGDADGQDGESECDDELLTVVLVMVAMGMDDGGDH